MKDFKQMENYLTVERQYSKAETEEILKPALTVGDLKKMLKDEDDSKPVILEILFNNDTPGSFTIEEAFLAQAFESTEYCDEVEVDKFTLQGASFCSAKEYNIEHKEEIQDNKDFLKNK